MAEDVHAILCCPSSNSWDSGKSGSEKSGSEKSGFENQVLKIGGGSCGWNEKEEPVVAVDRHCCGGGDCGGRAWEVGDEAGGLRLGVCVAVEANLC